MMVVRVRFAKRGKVRWTSHRDLARMWERALRRAGLPLSYTAGFSPRPRLSFGLALPTGHESVAEYLDVELSEEVALDGLAARLSGCLPAGVDATATRRVERSEGSLQQEVSSCSWRLSVHGAGAGRVEEAAVAALGAEALPVSRTRKGRQVTDDLRPSILALGAAGGGNGATVLEAELATRPRGVRPDELLCALGPDLELAGAIRTHQWIESDGARREPIPLGATDAPHALERAS